MLFLGSFESYPISRDWFRTFLLTLYKLLAMRSRRSRMFSLRQSVTGWALSNQNLTYLAGAAP